MIVKPAKFLTVKGDMQDGLIELAETSMNQFKFQYLTAISFRPDSTIVAWFNNQAYHSASLALNLVHNAILKTFSTTDYNIHLKNAPLKFMPKNNTTPDRFANNDSFGYGFSIIIALSMTFLSASYISFYIKV